MAPPPPRPPDTLRSLEGPVREFVTYVDGSLQEGQDGQGEKKAFIPEKNLETYWTQKKIRDVLGTCNPPVVQQGRIILHRYIRVFSTLVYTSLLGALNSFIEENLDDSWWLHHGIPQSWSKGHPLRGWCVEFLEWKWMFFPLKLHPDYLSNCRFHGDCILPIRSKMEIYKSRDTVVHRVTFHEACNDLGKDQRRPAKEFYALKTYRSRRSHVNESKRLFENEHRARTILDAYESENIVKFYGSFTQNNTYNLLLDWADGGSLGQFFKTNPPPATTQDLLRFWRSLVTVLRGLAYVHDGQRNGEDRDEDSWLMVHQDIKPDNILLNRSNKEVKSSFDFSPLLADFGLTQAKRINSKEKDSRTVPDRRGNQTYCAPECSVHAEYRLKKTWHRIGTPADIFSMGAVFSDAVVWTHRGEQGRRTYRKRRRGATADLPHFKGSGYDSCFHDSIKRLDVVDEEHRDLVTESGPFAIVTTRLVEVIEKHVLLERPDERYTADQLFQTFQHALNTAEKDIERHQSSVSPTQAASLSMPTPYPNPPITPTSRAFQQGTGLLTPSPTGDKYGRAPPLLQIPIRARPPSPVSPVTGDPFEDLSPAPLPAPVLMMSEAREYRESKKRGKVNPKLDATVAKLRTNLYGRDHFFFIDDTESMRSHAAEVQQVVTDLAYIAKTIDVNGIELAFASSIRTKTIHKARNSTELGAVLAQHQYAQHFSRFEDSMNALVDQVIIPRLPERMLGRIWPLWRKPISVFVFTDGIWSRDPGDGHACGVEKPIHNLMAEIIDRRVSRTQVMIQFIRFGNDPLGKKHLRYLDNFGQNLNCDIVDTRPSQGNVYAMFIGSISGPDDNVEDDEEPITADSPLQEKECL